MAPQIRRGEATCVVDASDPDQGKEQYLLALFREDAVRELSLPLLRKKESTLRIARERALGLNELVHLSGESFLRLRAHVVGFAAGLLGSSALGIG